MKPKVAVFMVGQPRYLTGKSYRSIKHNLIDKYDCTFFCHYWFDDKNPMSQSNWSGLNPEFICSPQTAEIINLFYKPVVCKFDIPLEKESIIQKYKSFHTSAPMTPYNLYSYYTSMKTCCSLYESHNKEKFDFYVKLRYDGILPCFPDLNNYTYDENAVIISNWHTGTQNYDSNTFVCKNENTFLTILKIVDYFDELSKRVKINDEEFFGEYCKMKNIKGIRVPRNVLNTLLLHDVNYDMS